MSSKSEPQSPIALSRFYPIVPDIDWLERILPLGVQLVQLRMKNADDTGVQIAARKAKALAQAHGAQLILNDYWQVAIDEKIDFIHLGQEDLASADLKALRRAGVRYGISTHSEDELDTALAAEPHYVALGPIYETKLKAMKWAPQGIERVSQWKKRVGALPLVAIGGLTLSRAPAVFSAGADSLAVITDFVTAAEPLQRVSAWVEAGKTW